MYTKLAMKQHVSIWHLLLLFFVTSALCPANASAQTEAIKYVTRYADGLNSPIRIAIDGDDHIYIADCGKRKIIKYDTTGIVLSELKAAQNSLAIAVNSKQQLFACHLDSGIISIVDIDGQLLNQIVDTQNRFGHITCAVFDNAGTLFLADSKNHCIHQIDRNNTILGSFGENELLFPTSIAFDAKNERLLVAEHGGISSSTGNASGHMIHIFDTTGDWVGGFGEYGSEQYQFVRIQGIAIDNIGRIYVTDMFQGSISVLDESGQFLYRIGEFGYEPGQFNAPMGIAIDSQNRLWIASMNNSCLEVFQIMDITPATHLSPAVVMPERSELLQNYPNPFNPGTWIPFRLARHSHVLVTIYNEMGMQIQSFDLGIIPAGNYSSEGKAVYWDGTNRLGNPVASGIYFCELQADEFITTRRMLIVK